MKDEFVMVPRELIARIARAGCWPNEADELRAVLAEQHQGEPVGLPARKNVTADWAVPGGPFRAEGHNACLDEIAKLGPLYTHADPAEVDLLRHDIASYLETMAKTCDLLGIDTESAKTAEGKPSDVLFKHAQDLRTEVERLRRLVDSKECERQQHLEECAAEVNAMRSQRVAWQALAAERLEVATGLRAQASQHKLAMDAACAQLAERDALLRKILEKLQEEYWDQYAGLDETRELIEATLSASAEPSMPKYHRSPLGMTEEIRRRLTLIAREAAISSTHRYNYMPTTPKDALLWQPHAWVLAAMRMVELSASAEPSAPVERDEPQPVPVAWMRFDDEQRAIFTRSKRTKDSEPLYAHPTAYRQARAALERKP